MGLWGNITVEESAEQLMRSRHNSYEACKSFYSEYYLKPNVKHCPVVWDVILCWPPTIAGTAAKQICPNTPAVNHTRHAYKVCTSEGLWEGYPGIPWGSSNYSECPDSYLFSSIKDMYAKILKINKERDAISTTGWNIEKSGLIISLMALVFSLIIFQKSRSMKLGITRLYKNLFVAMLVEVIMRLVVYIDRDLNIIYLDSYSISLRMKSTPVLCEVCYILMEYSRTVMFVWMLIDCLFLHNLLTKDKSLKKYLRFYVCVLVSWGAPVGVITVWAVTAIITRETENCLRGYTASPYFWILEGPRLSLITANVVILLNVVRRIFTCSELVSKEDKCQARRRVRSSLLLLPLLAINDIFLLVRFVIPRSYWNPHAGTYTFRFFKGYQGLFMSLLLCFLQTEVRNEIHYVVTSLWRRRKYERCIEEDEKNKNLKSYEDKTQEVGKYKNLKNHKDEVPCMISV